MKARKTWAFLMSVILMVTSLTTTPKAASVDTEGAASVSALTVSGDILSSDKHDNNSDGSYNGYIQSMTSTDHVTGDYYEVVFTSADTDIAAGTAIFCFQPYDTSWGGWEENPITIDDAEYDETSGTYTAYISIEEIKASLSTGKNLKGINISFYQASPQITLEELNVITLPVPEEKDWSQYDVSNILKASGNTLISSDSSHTPADSYDGYIQGLGVSSASEDDWVKVTFTVDGEITDETAVFNFQPYDSSWGGWNDNYVTIKDCELDGTTYTAYVNLKDVIDSLSTGKACKDINICFAAQMPTVTLLTLELLTPKAGGDDETGPSTTNPETMWTVTEEELDAAGVDWRGATKATVYIEMTEGGPDSILNLVAQLGRDADNNVVGKASSKYLVGRNVTSKSGNAIQDNLVGAAGTGYYKFPDVNLNKTMSDGSAWSSEYEDQVTITIRRMSADTDCKVLGIIFNNGAVYTVADGFSSSIVTESASYDEIKTGTEMRDKLGKTLDYIASMDSTKYQEASWNSFLAEVASAQAVYDDESSTESQCETTHAALEKAKAALLFVDDESSSNPLPFRVLDNDEIVYEMGVGINLGNTLDGHSGFTPSETTWQNVVTTKEYIEALHDAGYNTVRIPVTWGTMIDDENGYAINENWISRVQDIVDYCVSLDMYAIINIHHDGAEQTGWLRVASDDIDSVYEKFECVWRNIATRFKDYDEHLIFESMNEITCSENDKNGAEAIAYDTPIIMNLNQIFVNVVRSTGGNNTHRWLAAVSHYANNGTTANFAMPTDSYNTEHNSLMFAAHIYKSSTNVTWTYNEVYEVASSLQKMAAKFDVPLVLGEWGNRNYVQAGTETGYNDVARAYFCEIVTRACQVAGCVPVVWDQGYNDDNPIEESTGIYTYWDRANLKPVFSNIVEAMMRGIYLPATSSNLKWDFTDIVSDPEVAELTDLTLSDETVTLTIGDTYTVDASVLPQDSNDVVLWSSDCDDIATVYRGMIRAKAVGTTTIRAYSQSGSVEKTITVTVMPLATEEKAEITVQTPRVTVVAGKYAMADAVLTGAENDYLTYRSSNTDIATVDALGKIVGISNGTCYVYVTSASGITEQIKVEVTDSLSTNEAQLALHILYNDGVHNYWGTEYSAPIAVTGDGQYTVSFDLSQDLSKAGLAAGIEDLNRVTAIYIKDYLVSTGEATATPLASADIKYDKVIVNGQELTVIDNDFYSALTSAGVFDSGAPINAWGGTVVEEISISNHTASFSTIEKPTTIEVVFSLQNVEFTQTAPNRLNEAESMEAADDTVVEIAQVGDTAEITVALTPVDTDTLVSALSADESIAYVNTDAVSVNADGTVTIPVYAMGKGHTTVTVMTENGLTVTYTIYVEEKAPTEEPEPSEPEPSEPEETTPEETEPSSEPEETEPSSEPEETEPSSEPEETIPEEPTAEESASNTDNDSAATGNNGSMIWILLVIFASAIAMLMAAEERIRAKRR